MQIFSPHVCCTCGSSLPPLVGHVNNIQIKKLLISPCPFLQNAALKHLQPMLFSKVRASKENYTFVGLAFNLYVFKQTLECKKKSEVNGNKYSLNVVFS
jgi:hypothetical protein